LNWKYKWPYYVLSGILPVVLAVAAVNLNHPSNFTLPAWLQIATDSNSPLNNSIILFSQLLILSLLMSVIIFGQEFGWRGYLQKRLFRGNSLLAAIATGLIWGLWLILITWRAYRLPTLTTTELCFIPLVTVSLSIILGWIQDKTGNLWVPSLLGGTIATIGGSLIWAPVYVKPQTISLSPLGIWLLIPLICLCVGIIITELRNGNRGGHSEKKII